MSRSAVLWVPFPLIDECVYVRVLPLFHWIYSNLVLTLVAIARFCEVDWSAFEEQTWFQYECDDGCWIFLKADSIKEFPVGWIRIVAERWRRDLANLMFGVLVPWNEKGLCKSDVASEYLYWKDYYDFPLLESQDLLSNLRQSPACYVDAKRNANVGNDGWESGVAVARDDHHDKIYEGAILAWLCRARCLQTMILEFSIIISR